MSRSFTISLLACVLLLPFLGACGSPALSVALRSNFPPNVKIETKCWEVEERSATEFNRVMDWYAERDYRVAAIMDYTSTAKSGFAELICFERIAQPKQSKAPEPKAPEAKAPDSHP